MEIKAEAVRVNRILEQAHHLRSQQYIFEATRQWDRDGGGSFAEYIRKYVWMRLKQWRDKVPWN